MKQDTPARTWPRAIYDVFKQVGVEQIAFVPDAGHTQLIKECEADNAMAVVSLTTEEEGVARRLVSWCGLEWEPACLEFHQTERPVRTASVTQVRQPIYTRSVARWKHYEPAMGRLFEKLAPQTKRTEPGA